MIVFSHTQVTVNETTVGTKVQYCLFCFFSGEYKFFPLSDGWVKQINSKKHMGQELKILKAHYEVYSISLYHVNYPRTATS